MKYAVNSITSVNTMYLGVVNRFAYISTVVMLPASYNRPIEMKAVMAAVISILLLMGPFAFMEVYYLSTQANYQSGLKHGVIDGKDSCIRQMPLVCLRARTWVCASHMAVCARLCEGVL